jgi:glycosyltransferase involved in cell wall biosynthesis
LRLLTFCNCPLDEAQGSGYVVMRYVRGLRARGHEVELCGPPDYEPCFGAARAIRYRQAVGMASASLRRLARTDYDVLEYYGGEAWLAVSALARLPGRRFLLVCHSNGLETHCAEVLRAAAAAAPPAGGSRRWFQADLSGLAALAFRGADALVTVASYDREYALREGYAPPARVLAVDNPLPDSFLGLQVDFARGPVIGYCGSWLPRKGAALMERDLPPLLRDFPAWRLTLVGMGTDFCAEDHFPADVLPRITVVPHADRETTLRALYQGFAIVIVPSIYESFGLAAAEAMASGCALVATRVGFAASLVDGEQAILLPEPASPALHVALKAAIEDPVLRLRIAHGGYQRVQSLRWNRAIDKVEAAYLSWLTELRQS